MKIKVVHEFRDLKEKVTRKKNEVFTTTKERFEEINSTGFGVLAEEVKTVKGDKKNE